VKNGVKILLMGLLWDGISELWLALEGKKERLEMGAKIINKAAP
jgi:hypothetical protein